MNIRNLPKYLPTSPIFLGLDNNGVAVANGRLFAYAGGTITTKAMFSDPQFAAPLPQPVVLNSSGEVTLYGNGSYHLQLFDTSNNLVWEIDNYNFDSNNIIPHSIWTLIDNTINFINGTTFQVYGDKSALYTNARVLVYYGGGTLIGNTSSATFDSTSLTTNVVVTWDSGTLSAPVYGSYVALAVSGSGTVTSVGLSLPNIFTVSGSPVTSSGTLTGALASQSQNLVFASPNGSSGTPTFRALVAADIPGGLNLAIGTTNITSGTNGYLLYDNSGVLGNLAVSSLSIGWGQITGAPSFITGLTVGTTSVGSGTNGYLLYNNSGTLGNQAVSSLSIAWNQITSTPTTLAGYGITDAANQQLSNLSGTVAINLAMLPGTDNSIAVGSSSKRWTNAHLMDATLYGATSGNIQITAPATPTSYTLTLPSTAGTNGYVLQTNGSGTTSWVALPAAGLTVGSTAVASGTNGYLLYDNSGTLGNLAVSSLSIGWSQLTSTPTTLTGYGITSPLPLAQGGTAATSQQGAIDSLAGAVTSGYYLRGNGTHVVMSAIQAGDVPSLAYANQQLSNLSGTVAVNLSLIPGSNDAIDLGSSSLAWRAAYLAGSTSGYTKVQANATAGSWTLTLPSSAGSANQVLQTDGSGNTSWTTSGSGANTALSNLASVAINTSLLPASNGAANLGQDVGTTLLWGVVYAQGLSLGSGNINQPGSIHLYDSHTNNIIIKTVNNLGSNWFLTLPAGYPSSSGQALISDTSGNTSWGAPGGGSDLSKLIIKNNTTTPNTQIDYSWSSLVVGTAITTKTTTTIDATTNGINGLDVGALGASTWYYIWACNGTSGTGCVISLSSTSPTLPTGYTTNKRLIGAAMTDTFSHFFSFSQVDREVLFDDEHQESTSTATSFTAITLSFVPPICRRANLYCRSYQGISPGWLYTRITGSSGNGVNVFISNSATSTGVFSQNLNASNQFDLYWTVAPSSVTIGSRGFYLTI